MRTATREINGAIAKNHSPGSSSTTRCCAPHPHQGRNRISETVVTHDCTRDTVLGGAVATGVPHSLMDDVSCLHTVESCRETRRCRTPRGTASLDAVPQRRGCRSPSPGFPYFFGMVINSEPSHKCHRATRVWGVFPECKRVVNETVKSSRSRAVSSDVEVFSVPTKGYSPLSTPWLADAAVRSG